MSDQDASRRVVGISDVSVSTSSLSMLESMHANFTSSSNLIADSFTRPEPPEPLSTTDALPSTSRAPSPRPSFHAAMSVVQNASTEAPSPASSNKHGPVLNMTLLLTSGKRQSYKIDEKFLTTRNITIPRTTTDGKNDPYSISVYTLKELILREWREEWDARPSSPSGIRLIHFGRLLDDNSPLMNCRFNRESSNVVHMSIRPQEIVDEDEGSKSKGLSRGRRSSEATAGCRCAIM